MMNICMKLTNFFISKRNKDIIERIIREDSRSSKRVVGRGTLIMDAKEARNSEASKKLVEHIKHSNLLS